MAIRLLLVNQTAKTLTSGFSSNFSDGNMWDLFEYLRIVIIMIGPEMTGSRLIPATDLAGSNFSGWDKARRNGYADWLARCSACWLSSPTLVCHLGAWTKRRKNKNFSLKWEFGICFDWNSAHNSYNDKTDGLQFVNWLSSTEKITQIEDLVNVSLSALKKIHQNIDGY